MNNFRENLIRFLVYLKEYSKENTIISIIAILLTVILPLLSVSILDVFILYILATPIALVHITQASPAKAEMRSLSKDNKLPMLNRIKKLTGSYIKTYAVALLLIALSFALALASNALLITFSIANTGGNLGEYVVFMLIALLSFETITLFFSTLPAIVILNTCNKGIFKSMFTSIKFFRRYPVKHMLSVTLGVFMFSPLLILADALQSIAAVSYSLRIIYFIILVNYIIFDIKDKVKDLDNYQGFWSKILNR